jgi:hypothetical protein
MSQAQASPPPPSAAPCTRASVGFGHSAMRASMAAKRRVGEVVVLRGGRGALHPLQVGAGAEVLAGAGQHDGPHAGVAPELAKARPARRSAFRRRR